MQPDQSVIQDLQTQIEQMRIENESFKAEIADKENEIARLEKQLDAKTGVNRPLWKQSVTAALKIFLEIIQRGDKKDWTEEEFKNSCKGVNTDCLTIFWRNLPSEYKKGPGRPKNN